MAIDDRYTNGVWYDAQAGDFCEVSMVDDETVGLHVPGREDAYYEMDADWLDGEIDDLYPVPDEALEDPAGYFESWASEKFANEESLDVGLIYADEHTDVVESE